SPVTPLTGRRGPGRDASGTVAVRSLNRTPFPPPDSTSVWRDPEGNLAVTVWPASRRTRDNAGKVQVLSLRNTPAAPPAAAAPFPTEPDMLLSATWAGANHWYAIRAGKVSTSPMTSAAMPAATRRFPFAIAGLVHPVANNEPFSRRLFPPACVATPRNSGAITRRRALPDTKSHSREWPVIHDGVHYRSSVSVELTRPSLSRDAAEKL